MSLSKIVANAGKIQNLTRVFAIDVSGSTSGSNLYHTTCLSILNDLHRPNDVIIAWDSKAEIATIDQQKAWHQNKSGRGGTYPQVFIDMLYPIQNQIHLFLITDGEISTHDIDKCDQMFREKPLVFGFSDVIVICSYNSNPNISVACAFTRNCPHLVTGISSSKIEELRQVSAEDLAILDQIDEIKTIEELEAKYNALSNALTARLLGTVGDLELRNKVAQMQARVLRKKTTRKEGNLPLELFDALETKDQTKIAALTNNLVDSRFSDGAKLDAKVGALIRLCDGALRQTFNNSQIQAARAVRAADENQLETLDAGIAASQAGASFMCPVTYENETDPVIMITAVEEPFLKQFEQAEVNHMIDCPLNAMSNPKFITALVDRLDHPISITAVREANEVNRPIIESPITRKKLIGFVPLGPAESHVTAANWTLSKMLSGGKRLGNIDLWFAVLWMVIESGRVPYLQDMIPFLREQMLWRLRNKWSSASLCGSPTMLQTKVPLAVACWFCLNFDFIVQGKPEVSPFKMHCTHATQLKQLVEMIGFPLPADIDGYIKMTHSILALYRISKECRIDYKTVLRALYQNTLIINANKVEKELSKGRIFKGRCFIPLDGPASDEQIAAVRKLLPTALRTLPVEILLAIEKIVSPTVPAKALPIPTSIEPVPVPAVVTSWEHLNSPEKVELLKQIQICPLTMRPFTAQTVRVYGDGEKVLSTDRIFAELVIKLKKFPHKEDYLLFASKWVENKKLATTLPFNIDEIAQVVFQRFHQASKGCKIEVFKPRYQMSFGIDARKQMEAEEVALPSPDESAPKELRTVEEFQVLGSAPKPSK